MTDIFLKPKKEESVLRFHPWIFSGAIDRIKGKVKDGDLVRVLACDGRFLATGFYSTGSISVRILSFSDCEIDKSFFADRISSAFSLRKSCGLINGKNNIFRLVHGEGDGIPSLIVDIYGDTAIMQSHSIGIHLRRYMIAEAITESVRDDMGNSIVKAVFYKSENTLPKGTEDLSDGFIIGMTEEKAVYENGLLFMPDWLKGQKTGFFIDQRDNRKLVEMYAKDKRVLNAFCYTGGFSVYALNGGARSVTSLDSSAKAIYLTEQHVRMNFDNLEKERHIPICDDAFEYLNNMEENLYDLIILDPPAFAKHRKVLRNALTGYRRINTQAFRKIAGGGIIFTFSCSQAVSANEFRLAVFSSAAAAGRRVRILHQLTQPTDHPVNIYHPEGEYLKGLVLQVE